MFILNPYTAKPNTIIGGVGSVITTKSALATKLGVSENIIKSFKVIGNDVHFYAAADYQLGRGSPAYYPFSDDLTITNFIDLDGRVEFLSNSCFNGAKNLEEVYFPMAQTLGGAGTFIFRYCEKLHTAYLPSLDFATNQCFEDNYLLLNLTLTNCIQLATSTFYDCTSLTEIILPNLTTVTNKDSTFRNVSSCDLIDVKKLKNFGNAGNVNSHQNCFSGLKMGCTIRININQATINAGNANEALVWAKTNRSATVEFYDDAGNYVSTL